MKTIDKCPRKVFKQITDKALISNCRKGWIKVSILQKLKLKKNLGGGGCFGSPPGVIEGNGVNQIITPL